MRLTLLLLSMLFTFLACTAETEEESALADAEANAFFDQKKWQTKEGKDYPHREQMLDAVVYNDTIRTLSREELLALLGEPDRVNEGHLYYTISQTRLGFWTLHSRTMVVKIQEDDSIAWIKIHE